MNSNLSSAGGTSPCRRSHLLSSALPLILILLAAWCSAGSASAVPWISWHGLTAAQYQAEFNKWTGKPYGYRLVSVAGYEKDGAARYAAIWEEREGPVWAAQHGMTKEQYEAAAKKHAGEHRRPVFLSGFAVGNQSYYNAIWESAPGADVVSNAGLTWESYQALHSVRVASGYQLVHLWTWNAGSMELFAAIWRKGDPSEYQARLRRTSNEYENEFHQLSSAGYQLSVVSTAVIEGKALYSSIWKKPGGLGQGFSFHGLTFANFNAEGWNAYYQGYRPVLAGAFTHGGSERFNVIFRRNGGMTLDHLDLISATITEYMDTYKVPGLSLAISRHGRLVYAKGFGLADKGANERVHPRHRFRIASISKPITAAAILKLRDLCGLDLDQPVFGPNGILGEIYGNPPYNDWVKAITIRHLLHHTTGWTTDGIWKVSSDNPHDAIHWQMKDSQGKPSSAPGTSHTYMNIGYCVAGRVIERLTGRSYEKFVQDELLAPACVTDMEIGGRRLSDRKPNEVVYYQPGKAPYKLSPKRMDAHGGWIAKPLDLLLFLRRIDSNPAQAELLQEQTLEEMRTPSMAPGGAGSIYGLGLAVQGGQWWHSGAMNGTLGSLTYRDDGLAFAVTCNTFPGEDKYATVLKDLINDLLDALDSANAWPDLDLFACDIPPGEPPATMEVSRNIHVNGSANCPSPNGKKNCAHLQGPFPTVTSGFTAVCGNDRLYIRAGSYHETITFDRPVTVRSYDGSALIGK